MIYFLYTIIFLLIFTLGATIGSFLNVLAYRLPKKLDFVKGSSFCPSCEHKLGPLDLVPILSWVFLRGKCRYCKKPISPRYPIVEALAGALCLLTYLAYCPPVAFLPEVMTMPAARDMQIEQALICTGLVFLLICVLISIALIDADTMEIPNSLNIAVAILGALFVVAGFVFVPNFDWLSHVIGIFAVSVPMFILALIISGAFGGGDIKLMAGAGLFLGWQALLIAVFIGILIGGVYGIILLAKRKKGRKEHFAFGPSLCVGITVSIFCSSPIINWYLGFFL